MSEDKDSGRPGGLSSQATEPGTGSALRASIPDAEPRWWMKEPCGPCPFSRSKTLWLHPERAADFAYMAGNPYPVGWLVQ